MVKTQEFRVITITMAKRLLREARETAREDGLSRNGLISLAIEHQLNEVYAGAKPADKRLLKKIKAKVRTTIKDRW